MTITIHIGSMLTGVFFGFSLFAIVFWLISVNGDEFYKGWNCGRQYAEDRQKENLEKEKINDNAAV